MSRYVDAEYNLHDLPCYFDFSDEELIAISTVLKLIPTADAVEVKHGRWIDTGSGQECSICKEIQYGYDSARNYCSNCGARMDEREDEQ